MTRRLLLTYLSITAFALVIVVVPLGATFAGRERDRFLFDLERDAQAVAAQSEDDLEEGTRPDLAATFQAYVADEGRILVVDADGRSVADSSTADLGRDYSTRPEIARALAGERTTGSRRSATVGEPLVYVAIPVASRGEVHGAVRITFTSSAVDDRIRETWLRLAALSGVVLAAVGGVGLVLARSVTRPVRQVEAAAALLSDGHLGARAGTVQGPPEIAALARQFDATATRLEQLVEAQRRFVADASHQLRTPLAALRLRIETLRPAPGEEPRVAAALAEADRLGRLVESLLTLARAEATVPVPVEVDAAEIVVERVDAWADVAAERGIDLRVLAPARVPVSAVDGGLEQILDNLLANSLAVVPAGAAVEVSLEVTAEREVLLVVEDEGPGLEPDERARATGRFWRRAGSTTPGSGLGLAIVEELIRASGGRVALLAGAGGTGLRVEVHLGPVLASS